MTNSKVMLRAWQDFKIKKAHKGYENWTFSDSLKHAHKLRNILK